MRFLSIAFLYCVALVSTAWADSGKQTPLDLQPQANHKLNADYGTDDGTKGNNLATLPTGEQILAGIKFNIGEGMILLSGNSSTQKPKKVEGIAVGAKASKLHFLHATHWMPPEDKKSAKKEVVVGHYTVHYEDKSQEMIPIVYGKDIGNWWYFEGDKGPSRAKVAWMGEVKLTAKGEDDVVKKWGSKIRLCQSTWENPQPAKKIVGIDFDSTNETQCAPFCVAITAEE